MRLHKIIGHMRGSFCTTPSSYLSRNQVSESSKKISNLICPFTVLKQRSEKLHLQCREYEQEKRRFTSFSPYPIAFLAKVENAAKQCIWLQQEKNRLYYEYHNGRSDFINKLQKYTDDLLYPPCDYDPKADCMEEVIAEIKKKQISFTNQPLCSLSREVSDLSLRIINRCQGNIFYYSQKLSSMENKEIREWLSEKSHLMRKKSDLDAHIEGEKRKIDDMIRSIREILVKLGCPTESCTEYMKRK